MSDRRSKQTKYSQTLYR